MVTFLILSIKGPLWYFINKIRFLSPLVFALGYAIRKVQGYRVGQKLNGTHQLLVCADDVTLLEDNMMPLRKTLKL
jgi:hypothetical protein